MALIDFEFLSLALPTSFFIGLVFHTQFVCFVPKVNLYLSYCFLDSDIEEEIFRRLPRHLVSKRDAPAARNVDTTSSVSLAVEDQTQHANGCLQYNGDLQPTEIPVPENIRPTSPPEEIPNNEVRGRKRAKNEDTWKRNQRKRLKKQGKSYT